MTTLPMFPLGSVLFPHLPLQLRVFEERYLVMLSRILAVEPAEFGVVLIERGQEVGGGEKRFSVGTVARISQVEAVEVPEGDEGFVMLVAVGSRRIEVLNWLDEDPYPEAAVRELPDLAWDDSLLPLWDRAEQVVRRCLALASEFTELEWSPQVELSGDPVEAAWQLAGISPLGPLDRMRLLRSETMAELLQLLIDLTTDAEESLRAPWPEE
jgi:Lon protease-like protein